MGAELAVRFPEYRETIVEYLCTSRVPHWEIDVRTSAAKALTIITNDPSSLELYLTHIPQLLLDAKCQTNDYKTHGSVLALAHTFQKFIKIRPNLMAGVNEIISVLIESRHFKTPDLMSHIIRPSILMLLTEYARCATQSGTGMENFSSWLGTIQNSLLKMGTLKENRKQQNLRNLCEQITPAMEILLVEIPLEQQKIKCEELIGLLVSNQTSVLENARICACYILKSYTCFEMSNAIKLLDILLEGAREIFNMKSTHPRAFFVEVRAEILSYIIDLFLKSNPDDGEILNQIFGAILECFDDYTRNQKGDIGSVVRVGAMQGIQKLARFLPKIPADMYKALLGRLLQQGAEKILRIREEVGRTLLEVRDNPRKDIEELNILNKILIPKRLVSGRLWISDWGLERRFPCYTKILKIGEFKILNFLGHLKSKTFEQKHFFGKTCQKFFIPNLFVV
mgnify:CR=1 FL=1